ncbi:2250_t:CDS:2 [Acaulospora colombiana]|uniref:2250_t:CDS:1 n=1 Tax=Acaulospora colombiana TaxID=27376 RepID=A0ACA9M577_9GLOM|nr:2250_t:CDS:2 [Acaulospora colombiana]
MNSNPSSPTTNGRLSFETVRRWKIEQVKNWLQENSLEVYQQNFEDNDINGNVLLELDYEVLKEMNIGSIGDRVRVLSAVKSLLRMCVESSHPNYFGLSKNYTDKIPVKLVSTVENAKSRYIKVIGEDKTRTIDINDISDAQSILAKVLQKFNINEDVEKYSLFTTSETGTEYFPGHASEELERSARNSIRRASRLSAASRYSKTRSKHISKFYDEDDINSSGLLAPPSDDPRPTIPEEETEEAEESEESEEAVEAMEAMEEESEEFEEYEKEDWSSNGKRLFDRQRIRKSIRSNEKKKIILSQSENSVFKWIKGTFIGMGSFGSVYLGLNAVTGALMAVKQLDALEREITLLKDLHHENIVQYLGSQHDGKTLNIFLEYVPGGSVASMLNTYGPQEETLIRSFVRQILKGLSYLHDKEIVHRDIKGANILGKDCSYNLDTSYFFRYISEFMAAQRTSLQGSIFWMAPEVIKQTAYTNKADVWSLGCLIVEMYTGEHPFPELNQMQAMYRIGSQSCSPKIPDCVSNEARDFLKKTFEL